MKLPDFGARRRKSVLLIGGGCARRALIKGRLCAAGHEVTDIDDCARAFALIEQNPPDMVIVDAETADCCDASLFSILRTRFPRIPVITLNEDDSVEGRGTICVSREAGEMMRGEALLAAGRSLLDMIRTIDQTPPPPRLLNQYW